MNTEYIKVIFEENKDIFKESGLDVESPEDLKDIMISYIISNMQYDFGIDLDKNKLFKESE